MPNKNLLHAQKLFISLEQNEVPASLIPERIRNIQTKLKQAGATDLGVLDSSGETSEGEIQHFFASLLERVQAREVASYLQYRIDQLRSYGREEVDLAKEPMLSSHLQIPVLLEEAGRENLLKNGHAPTVKELEAVASELQAEIAADPLGTGIAQRAAVKGGRG